MTKYEKIYGVTVDHFPNEKDNVREKLRLAMEMRNKIILENRPYSYENECEMAEINQAITWCEKILKDIDE